MGTRIQKISKYRPSIFQGSFRFSPAHGSFFRRENLSLTAEHPIERAMFRLIAAALLILIGAYVYFVSASVFNVVARKEALAQTSSLGSSLSFLERDYYTMAGAVKPSEGERLGLTPVSSTRYVYRPGTIGAVDLRSNEI